MASESKLVLLIEAKNRARRAFSSAKRQVTGVMDSIKSRAQRVRKAIFSWRGALAAAGAAFAATRIGQRLIELSTRVEETGDKFREVFGPQSQTILPFLDEFSTKVGASTNEMKEFAASSGGILQGLGLTQERAAEASEQVLRLAGDMQSFNNVPMEQSVNAITSALAGERERLKQLNVVVRQADVNQRALAMTNKEGAEALTEQEKAMATLLEIQDKMGQQVGNLNATLDSNEGRLRQIRGLAKEVRDTFGRALIPVLDHVIGRFSGANETLEETADRIQRMQPEMVGFMETFLDTVGLILLETPKLIGQVLGDVGAILVSAFLAAFNRVKANFNALLNFLSAGVNDFIGLVNQIPGVEIPFELEEGREVESLLQKSREHNRIIETATGNIVGNVAEWGEAAGEVFEMTARTREEAEKAADATERAASSGGPSAGAQGEVVGEGGVRMPGVGGGGGLPADQLVDPIREANIAALDLRGTWQKVEDQIRSTASSQQFLAQQLFQFTQDFSKAFEKAAKAVVTGNQDAADAFMQAQLEAIASVASALSRLYAAKAAAALAAGLAGDPSKFAAAAKFSAASALAAAVAGGISGGASMIGGRGGGGAAGARQRQQDRIGAAREDRPLQVVIEGGILDLNDPRQARQFRRMMEDSTGRDVIVHGA